MKIYVPYDRKQDYACYSVYNKDTIRAYRTSPTLNSSSNYDDFYVNSHYISRQGQETWNQYTTLPSCINSDNITNNVFFRNDINDILVTFIIILLICFYLPYRIISRLFGRWLKL